MGYPIHALEIKGPPAPDRGLIPVRYFETPLDDALEQRLGAIHAAGGLAKVRTGGTTAESFPSSGSLTRFLVASARLRLPSKRFYRHIGIYADKPFDVDGRLLPQDEWEKRKGEWLPTASDRAYIAALQKQVREPGRIAHWIGKPPRGIKGLPFEHEYVRLD